MTTTLQPSLSYSTFVPKHHVHRAAICEVFLTDILCESFPHFSVGLQLPRAHSFYSDHDLDRQLYDPMLLLEAFRQASILIAHRHVEAPMESKFVFNDGDLVVTSLDALTMGVRPSDGIIDATIVKEKQRGDLTVGITLEMTMRISDLDAATMRMAIQWMPPAAWDALRARGREPLEYRLSPTSPHPLRERIAAREVGRSSAANVVIGAFDVRPDQLDARVVVDERHPGLFDHPLDHIPGVVIFEAMRQSSVVAAHELLGLSPRRVVVIGCQVAFQSFGELDLPTDCVVTPRASERSGALVFDVAVRQEGRSIASGSVTLQRLLRVAGSTTEVTR